MSCEVASWIPNVVVETLRASTAAQPVVAWLSVIRASIEEYDPLVVVRPPSADSETSDTSTTTPDSAFDEILSQLGKEIFKLDEYQRNLLPDEREVSLSILNIFDECLEDMTEVDIPLNNNEHASTDIAQVTPNENSALNGDADCSDSDSTVSDISYVTSTPRGSMKVSDNNVNSFAGKGDGRPVPAPRTRLKPVAISSVHENEDIKTYPEGRGRFGSECDSDSTCWSYQECRSDAESEPLNRYAEVWAHSSGFHNSDALMQRVLAKNYAVVSRLSFDSASDLEPAEFTVYALPGPQVGDRWAGDAGAGRPPPVAAMTPARPADDGYEPVRDALPAPDENIYEEIEYGYTDEGCSCGGSVEVESCSISASSEGVGRESPFYANLRDHDAYAITHDVLFWKNLLLDPLFNDDEEDEWITPEEYAVYSRDQRPPLVIPRISQHRGPRSRQLPLPHPHQHQHPHYPVHHNHHCLEESVRFDEWGAVCERPRGKERSFIRAAESPTFGRLDKRLGASTENLLAPRRPQHLQLPPSSSGDSLDYEVREKEGSEYSRTRKSRSMVAPKPRKSPVPAPRTLVQPSSEAAVTYEGPVKRTKYMESSKKTKKNWTDCYMLLTTTALVFYKDQKTYLASKAPRPAGSPGSPGGARAELVLPLRNAHVQPCCNKHTRRYTRSLVLLVNYDQYLIQDESEDNAKTWLRYIQTTIYNLGPPEAPPPGGNVTPQQSSGTDLESLGRTPPPHRHINRGKPKAGGSSNEDLSDSTEKSHIKSKIRKFLNKRPSKDVLMTKGIWKDEPVFGRNLDKVCPETSPRVPAFVVACIREIESSEENMTTDGLYRASGNLSQVQKIRLEVDQNNLKVVEESTDIHVLTGSLKLFFRELKEPVIPCHMFDRVLAACSIKPREAKVKEFREIIQALPECNRDTLKFLLEHLLKVTKYSERNRMHTANLAIVFGPTLLWAPAEQAHNIAIDCIQQNNVVETLLNDFKEIFVDGKKKA